MLVRSFQVQVGWPPALPPRRNPYNTVDFVECPSSELPRFFARPPTRRRLGSCRSDHSVPLPWLFLHRDKPLFRRPEDDRVLAAPAVRVGMCDCAVVEQNASRSQTFDNGWVSFQHMLSGELFDRFREAANVIYRDKYFESLRENGVITRRVIFEGELVVLLPVPWR